MNTPLNAIRWSERAVGSRLRFIVTVFAQVGGVLFACWLAEWHHVGPLVCFGLMLPLGYLIALRGAIRELHRKTERHEEFAA